MASSPFRIDAANYITGLLMALGSSRDDGLRRTRLWFGQRVVQYVDDQIAEHVDDQQVPAKEPVFEFPG
jgi:hypothetical protein